jgi:hypothetical protein
MSSVPYPTLNLGCGIRQIVTTVICEMRRLAVCDWELGQRDAPFDRVTTRRSPRGGSQLARLHAQACDDRIESWEDAAHRIGRHLEPELHTNSLVFL